MVARMHLFTDADNTLWDTNGVFVDAQRAMLRELETATGLCAPEAFRARPRAANRCSRGVVYFSGAVFHHSLAAL